MFHYFKSYIMGLQ